MITRSGRRKSHTRTFTGISSHPLPFISIPSKSALSIPWDRGMPSNTRFCATAKSAVPFTMPFYDIDPLVSINGDDIANVFYPSRIDNSKIMIGCQNSEFPRSSVIVDLSVVTVDTGWNYKHENIHMSRERRKERPYPVLQLNPHPTESFTAGPYSFVVYTLASANALGSVMLWDIDYNKLVKTYSKLGNHPSMCQGLSWNPKNPNLLLSCGQDGSVYLWVGLMAFH